MTLELNTQIGPYEILAKIGAGGMGEVFRARDSRLSRDVAIKILPVHYSSSDDRLSRFEQEARATGALNHPNIVSIFDFGSHDGSPYVVTEFLEGETLRSKLKSGPLSPRKALDFGAQMARGLAAAHEKGIIHRDVKPENIYLTRDGRLKILDFGLAKVTSELSFSTNDSTVATLRAPTNPGVVMGTVGYMSPEQVRGLPVDHRSDIFSFGTVLYEMLTGEQAFRGDSAVEVMNAILKDEPVEPSSFVGSLPPGVDRVLHHCLEKQADSRFQSASDLAFDLDALSLSSGSYRSSGFRSGARRSLISPLVRRRIVRTSLALVLAVALAAGGLFAGRWFWPSTVPTVSEFSQLTFRRGALHSARFSSDGQTILYSAAWDGEASEIYLVRPGSPESRPLNLKDTAILSVAASGEMAVLQKSTLGRVALTGGAPRAVAEEVHGADWNPGGDELAVVRYVDGKHRLEYPLGNVIHESDAGLASPRFSPDGKLIAFLLHPIANDDRGSVMITDLQGKVTEVSNSWTSLGGLAWSPGGREIWFAAARTGANRSLWAATPGSEARLVSSVAGSLYLHDIASDGRVLVSRETVRSEILVHRPGETRERDLSWLDGSTAADISQDGSMLLFSELNHGGGTNYSVYLRKTDGSPAIRLGDGNATGLSPDGKWALAIQPTTPPSLVALPTGAGDSRTVLRDGFDQIFTAKWFPDGRRILLLASQPGQQIRSYLLDLDSGEAPRALTEEGHYGALLTPDGSALAVVNEATFTWTLMPIAGGPGTPIRGLKEGEIPVRWAEDGKHLFLRVTKQFPVTIMRLDPATGRREPVVETKPVDMTGVKPWPRGVLMSADGEIYAYSYLRALSELYLVEGVRA